MSPWLVKLWTKFQVKWHVTCHTMCLATCHAMCYARCHARCHATCHATCYATVATCHAMSKKFSLQKFFLWIFNFVWKVEKWPYKFGSENAISRFFARDCIAMRFGYVSVLHCNSISVSNRFRVNVRLVLDRVSVMYHSSLTVLVTVYPFLFSFYLVFE